MVDDIAAQWNELHSPTCRTDMDGANAVGTTQRHLDGLYQHALAYAPTCTAVKFSHCPGFGSRQPSFCTAREPASLQPMVAGGLGLASTANGPAPFAIGKINAMSPATAFHLDQVAKAG